jgi:predicted GH43/DUF377 family glycosyl hydrolase
MKIKNLGIILEPTKYEFEDQAALNPGCITVDGITHMYYRAVHYGNRSSIGYCQLKREKVIERWDHPLLIPEYDYEKQGIEDPRVVYLDGTYYLFYAAYDGKNATSKDLIHFEKQGVITPNIKYADAAALFPDSYLLKRYQWYGRHYQEAIAPDVTLWLKDTFIFPKKINGQFLLMTRIMPGIQMIPFENFSDLTLEWWKKQLSHIDRSIVLQPKFWFETRKIGNGCPPIETPDGWVCIYHGVEDSPHGNVYHAAAALLDLQDPTKVIARLPEPLFSPSQPWELNGTVSNVVFPSGASLDGDSLIVFYGAADSRIAAKEISMAELLSELKQHAVK